MKYEVLKKSSFIKVKSSQITKYQKYEYFIEKTRNGKVAQSKYLTSLFQLFLNNIKVKNRINIFYKNNNSAEKYSKD